MKTEKKRIQKKNKSCDPLFFDDPGNKKPRHGYRSPKDDLQKIAVLQVQYGEDQRNDGNEINDPESAPEHFCRLVGIQKRKNFPGAWRDAVKFRGKQILPAVDQLPFQSDFNGHLYRLILIVLIIP